MAHAHQHLGADRVVSAKKLEVSSRHEHHADDRRAARAAGHLHGRAAAVAARTRRQPAGGDQDTRSSRSRTSRRSCSNYSADKKISVNNQDVTVRELEERLRTIFEQRKDKTHVHHGRADPPLRRHHRSHRRGQGRRRREGRHRDRRHAPSRRRQRARHTVRCPRGGATRRAAHIANPRPPRAPHRATSARQGLRQGRPFSSSRKRPRRSRGNPRRAAFAPAGCDEASTHLSHFAQCLRAGGAVLRAAVCVVAGDARIHALTTDRHHLPPSHRPPIDGAPPRRRSGAAAARSHVRSVVQWPGQRRPLRRARRLPALHAVAADSSGVGARTLQFGTAVYVAPTVRNRPDVGDFIRHELVHVLLLRNTALSSRVALSRHWWLLEGLSVRVRQPQQLPASGRAPRHGVGR